MTTDLDRLLEKARKVLEVEGWSKDTFTQAHFEFREVATPQTIIRLIERVKDAERYPGATQGAAAVIEHATKRIDTLEARLRAAEEVVGAARKYSTVRYVEEAIRRYDRATKETPKQAKGRRCGRGSPEGLVLCDRAWGHYGDHGREAIATSWPSDTTTRRLEG